MKTTGPSGPADWTSVSSLPTRALRPSAVRKRAPEGVRSMTYVIAARRSRNAASLIMFLPLRSRTLVASGHEGHLTTPWAGDTPSLHPREYQVCPLKAPAPSRYLLRPYHTPQRSLGGCRVVWLLQ